MRRTGHHGVASATDDEPASSALRELNQDLDYGLRRAEIAAIDVADVGLEGHRVAVLCSYDAMLRLKAIKPSSASGLAWAFYEYLNATGGSFAMVRQMASANGTDCRTAGTPLLSKEWQLDGSGRPHLEFQRATLAPETWDRRVTRYDGEGRKILASERTGPNDAD